MIYAVLIDDESNGLKSLELLLGTMSDEIKVVGVTTDALQAIELVNAYRPDVVFLDISMPQLDGFEVLDRLEFKNFHLVFTTAHQKYALRALKHGATDYLLKPIDRRELQAALDRVKQRMHAGSKIPDVYELLKRINETQNARVVLPTRAGTEYVMSSNIVYVEADSNHAVVSLVNGECIRVLSSLKDFEVQLCKKDGSYMRVHNSYIINCDYVVRYMKDDGGIAVMQGKKAIPISRQRKDEFLKAINFPV